MEAYDSLSESHKAKKAITHWSTMSFDKQKKVKFRYNNNLWSCNIGNTGWTLIDSQQYVKDHLPNDILDINEDLNKRREAFLIKNIGIIQHMTSEGLAVHFTEDAAIRYVAESTDI